LIRVVLDANVIISGLLSKHGPPGQILDAWLNQQIAVFVSDQIITEIHNVLEYPRIRDRLEPGLVTQLVENLTELCECTESELILDILRIDPSDNIYLSCAVEASADYLVTGNPKHYQEAGNLYRGIYILTPREFLKILRTN
jgi:putative PIN family toxin of toxin-antitoxin system